GYLGDGILGGPLVHYEPRHETAPLSFETVFAYYNRYGFHPKVLGRLLRRDVFGGLIEHTVDRIRHVYNSYSDLESQRAWCFQLYQRQRFHVGAGTWRVSFGAWPVLPVIDREVLQAVGAMPASTIAGRRAQRELVCRRFPDLAALPLDRNSYDRRPLQPGLWWLLSDYFRRPATRVVHSLPAALRQERRYFYRVYDINNPGWQAVRKKADAHRSRVLHLLERGALNALLPPAGTEVQCPDAIIDSSALKELLGFLLWSEDHL
ncbi:MAG: hypothetical protein ACRDIB_14335, partial [Ardenticatenaceae bacterium]